MENLDSRLHTLLHQAVNRQSPQHEEWRRTASRATTRDTHPTTGSASILQAAQSNTAPRLVSSLNTADGGRAFMFDVDGFGFDQGELS